MGIQRPLRSVVPPSATRRWPEPVAIPSLMRPWFRRVLQNQLPARKTECDVLSQYSVFPQFSCCQHAVPPSGRPGVNVSVFPSGWSATRKLARKGDGGTSKLRAGLLQWTSETCRLLGLESNTLPRVAFQWNEIAGIK